MRLVRLRPMGLSPTAVRHALSEESAVLSLDRRLVSLGAAAAAALALMAGVASPHASAAARRASCNQPVGGGSLAAAGISNGQSATRYDGIEVEITAQSAPAGLYGCESIHATVLLGHPTGEMNSVSLEINAHARTPGYRPDVFWMSNGTGHLAPVTIPGLPWQQGSRHRLRVLHVGTTTKWLLAIDERPLGTVTIPGSSRGLQSPRAFASTVNYDHGPNAASFKFANLHVLTAGATRWQTLTSAHFYKVGKGTGASWLKDGAFVVKSN
jgi:hypothetical protein